MAIENQGQQLETNHRYIFDSNKNPATLHTENGNKGN